MDLNKIIFLMMLCVPMFVGAQTLTFTDHEPMGNMRTQVTRQFFRLIEQESRGRIRIDLQLHLPVYFKFTRGDWEHGANIINAEPGNLIIHDAKHTNCVYRLWDKIPWTGEE